MASHPHLEHGDDGLAALDDLYQARQQACACLQQTCSLLWSQLHRCLHSNKRCMRPSLQ